jgi:4-hydroxy-2-oxoglutarate aldolase
MAARLELSGIFPPIPTPFDESGTILFDRLEENLRRWQTEPIAGYVVGGSNGEFPLLTLDERVEMIRHVRALAPGRRLLAGSGCQSTTATIQLTERMAAAGADAAIVVTPGYYMSRMTDAALVEHYASLADRSPLPIVLYNVPANTGVDLSAEAAVELSRHPRIIGIKDSAGDVAKLSRMVEESAEGFQVMAGSAGFYLAALAVGAVGVVAALANVAAESMEAIRAAFAGGDIEGARRRQGRLIEINRAVTSRFGVPGLKAAMDQSGRYGGPPRRPLLPLGADDRQAVRQAMLGAGLLEG